METLPLLISLIPTLVLLGLVGAFRFRSIMLPVLWMGVILGVANGSGTEWFWEWFCQ